MPGAHIHDVIIVGGGIAGLSAAWRLRDRDILVLEAGDRPGGRICSVDGDNGVMNFGAHMFGGPGTIVGDLCCALGLSLRPIDAGLMAIALKGRLRLKGRAELLPFLLPLAPAARLSLIKAGLGLRLGSGKAAAMLRRTADEPWPEMTRQRLDFAGAETLAERLGCLHPQAALIIRAITERCGGDPSGISAGHGLRSFANVWSSTSPGFHLVGGSSRLPEALAERLGRRLRLQTPVRHVERGEGSLEVRVDGKGAETVRHFARTVILATPATQTRTIMPALRSSVKAALGEIRYGPFLSVALNTAEQAPGRLERTYAVSTPDSAFGVLFNQSVNRFSLAGHEKGGSLMMFAGAARAEKLMQLGDDEIASRFAGDLRKLLPELIPAGAPVVKRWPLGAPYAFTGRAALQPALTQSLERIALAGDYLEFPNMEAAIRSGNEAADRVLRWL